MPTNSNARLESNPPRASRESIDSTEAAAAGANAPAPAAIRARPAPNKKSYLPTYAAPEAYGKKANNRLAEVRKEAEEKVAKQMAKKERERKLSRQKAKKNLIAVEETTEDDVEAWLATANKVAVEDDRSAETALVEDTKAELRALAAKLDDTRWLYEDMPANPEALEASVGV